MPALIVRKDPTTRLTARSIAVLHRGHAVAADVERIWRAECAGAATLCAPLVTRATVETVSAVAVTGPAAVEAALATLVRGMLTRLGAGAVRTDAGTASTPRLRPSTGLDQARARAARQRAEWLGLKEQIQAGTLVSAASVERVWGARILAARSLLLALAVTLADRLHRAAILGDLGAVATTLKASLRDVLRELESR